MRERLVIRSYRRVWNVDRRVYYFDPANKRWPVPAPGGVPVRGLAYFLAALAAVLVAQRLPGLGLAIGALSPPLRYVLLPTAAAVAATRALPDGRPAHRYVLGWAAWRLRAPRTSAGRPVPEEGEPVRWGGRLRVRHDADSPRLRRARVTGVASVTFNVPVALRHRRGRLVVRGAREGRAPQVVVTHASERLEVRP